MQTRTSYIGERLRNSYWFVPSLMLAGAVVLATVTIELDEAYAPEQTPWLGQLLYSGGAAGARELLGAIASSMITVAGVVFSIAIVTLQLASSQFGPRMLANFIRDRGNQVTLGTFVATFLYSLLVLRTVRTTDPVAVPHLSVTVALLLAVAGLSVLIYFIHHVATTIQAPNLIQGIASELRHGTDRIFPNVAETDHARTPEAPPVVPSDLEEHSRPVTAPSSGYVQVIDIEHLTALAQKHDLVIRLETRAGRFVVDNTTFALAYPASRVTDEIAEEAASSLVTGSRRTAQHDIEFPVRQLVEIAVRALSPGINDPFTAGTCVSQIGAGLCEVARREFPPPYVLDEAGALRIVVGDPVTWERMVGGAYDQIRQCAHFHTAVYLQVLESLAQIVGCVRDPARVEPLLVEGRLMLEAAESNVAAEADLAVVRGRYDDLLAAVRQAR